MRPSLGRISVFALALLACFLVGPAARPARARASVYEVDSIGDQADQAPGSGGCETAVGSCTLRAAIEEANQSVETLDTIVFDLGFNGQLADTIKLGSELPQLEGPLTIKGDRFGQCTTAASIPGPCVGLDATAASDALRVRSDGVSIEGLAISGAATTGIEVGEGITSFIVRDDWVGVKLGGASAGGEFGIVLEPGADGAKIGGLAAADRVVVAGDSEIGLDVRGASDTVVEGDYFGVRPEGEVAYPDKIDIRVGDENGFKAEEIQIGAELTPQAAATPACDGGCNLIDGAEEVGVHFPDKFPAVPGSNGPAAIEGNYIGLDAAGTGVVPDETGIEVEDSHGLTIGGAAPGDANYLAGGSAALFVINAGSDFTVRGNRVGVGSAGEPIAPPSEGFFVRVKPFAGGLVPTIAENELRLAGGVGITEDNVGATITGNRVRGAQVGIHVYNFSELHPNTIRENRVEDATEDGILVESDLNEIAANEVVDSGRSGIRIESLAPGIIHNLVGGDLPGDENVIDGSGGDAIAVVDTEGSDNEIARNRGSGNGGRFIHLIAAEPGSEPNGPNEGVKPPAFGAATETGAGGGGAEPGARIRVFRKATGALGEVQSFLGEATVDGSGNWSLAYPASIPAGTFVAATQTNVEGGTSELSIATTSGESGGGGGSGGGSATDLIPPQTTILRGPKPKATNRTRTFSFVSSEPGSTFECKLDRKPFGKCRSPKTYKKLKPGKHVFQVRAVNGGRVDPTPAKRKFTVLS